MGVLRLKAIAVCEDVIQRASLQGTNNGATLANVSDYVVELSFSVCHQPPRQFFSASLAALRELADDAAP